MLVDFLKGNVVVGDSLIGVGILFMGGGTRPAKAFRVSLTSCFQSVLVVSVRQTATVSE
jgi:hypothetical protein